MGKIPRKIYFDKTTGNVLADTGEIEGFVRETTVEEDIQNYKILSERNVESFGVIQLEFGQFRQDFAECNGYRINPETLEIEFSYPIPDEDEPVYQKPLSLEVKEIQQKVDEQDAIIEDLLFNIVPSLIGGGEA